MKTKKTLAMVGIFLFLAIRPSVASSFTERTYLLPTRLEGSCRPVLLLSGTWDFKYSPESRWTSIQVPGEAAMQGFAIEHDKPFFIRKISRYPLIMQANGLYYGLMGYIAMPD